MITFNLFLFIVYALVYYLILGFLKKKIASSSKYYGLAIFLAVIFIFIVSGLISSLLALIIGKEFTIFYINWVAAAYLMIYYFGLIVVLALLRILEFNREHPSLPEQTVVIQNTATQISASPINNAPIFTQIDNSTKRKFDKMIYGALVFSALAWLFYSLLSPIAIVLVILAIILVVLSLIKFKQLKLYQIILSIIILFASLGYLVFIAYFFLNFNALDVKWSRKDLEQMIPKIELYKGQNGHWPDNLQLVFPYIKKIIQDNRFNTPIHYKVSVDGQSYELWSTGKDGIDGTKDDIYPNLENVERGETYMHNNIGYLDGYKNKYGRYPDALDQALQRGFPIFTRDFFDMPYYYKVSADGQSYEMRILGPDGKYGTVDDITL